MGRKEDNYKNLQQISEDTQERGRCRNFGISEKSSYNLGNIAILLADISESLAIIAEHYETEVEEDKAESEEA